jgi:hypothetical protein
MASELFYGTDGIITYNPLHYTARANQKVVERCAYKFETEEEIEEFNQRYRDARLGDKTTGEQKNTTDRIYKMICMKRRMKAKALKKQQK